MSTLREVVGGKTKKIVYRWPFNFLYGFTVGDGCWLWTRSCFKAGYGQVRKGSRNRVAHQVSWEFFRGEIPNGLCVCHRCNIKKCVRPSHLYLATNEQNLIDAKADGLMMRGENHPSAKLKEADIIEIRRLHKNGESFASLERKFSVSDSAIQFIVSRHSWEHVK